MAVDPGDAQRVLLLFNGTTQQKLALTRDGGKTVAPVLNTDGYLTSYARTAQGTILIGGIDIATNPVLFASHDGGLTFAMVPNPPPHIRGLAARDGNVYAATDNFGDGYALGITTDEGMTWRPVMSYDRMTAIVGCVKASCQTLCAQEVTMGLWSENACTADPPVVSPDAGADASHVDDGGGAADAGASGGGSGCDRGRIRGYAGGPPRAGGGSCTVSPGHTRDQAWWILLGLIVSRQRQRQRRRGQRGAPGESRSSDGRRRPHPRVGRPAKQDVGGQGAEEQQRGRRQQPEEHGARQRDVGARRDAEQAQGQTGADQRRATRQRPQPSGIQIGQAPPDQLLLRQ